MQNLEFRGRWLDIFGNVLLITILSTITLGIYAPWGYARFRRVIVSRTYLQDQPLHFDGTGGQAFVEFLIIAALSIITLGLYGILGFANTRLLRWQYAHTVLPTGERLEYRGDAVDLFFEYFLLVLFSALTLGIYSFWGYVRIRRYILGQTYVGDQPLKFTGSGLRYLGISLLNWILTVITLGFYAILGFATVRILRWDAQETQVPEITSSRRPMPVHSPTVSALGSAAPAEPGMGAPERAFTPAPQGHPAPQSQPAPEGQPARENRPRQEGWAAEDITPAGGRQAQQTRPSRQDRPAQLPPREQGSYSRPESPSPMPRQQPYRPSPTYPERNQPLDDTRD